ncbi:hypothetical protein BKI52_05990 [marine bacterium AO1-C]|nr:hypothetical protein BKI52_05990 [marine bacterium AO1-C]
MKEFVNDQFNRVYFDESNAIHYHITKADTAIMLEHDFKEMLLKWKESVFEVNPKKILVNNLEFDFPISPELQMWTVANASKPVMELPSVEKFCFVMPTELVPKLSVSQLTQESNKMGGRIQLRFFGSYENAHNWLLT